MRTTHRIGIGFLVGLFFVGGYGARIAVHNNELAMAKAQQGVMSVPGQIASSRLEYAADIDLRPLQTMLMVLKNLREHYVEQLTPQDEGKMTHDSIKSMLAALNDPNTQFLEPDQREMISDAANAEFHGIGAILGIRRIKTKNLTEEHLVVVSPVESGPADQAGLKAGDDIVSIDGMDVLPFNPYQRAESIIKDEKNNKDTTEVIKHLNAEKDKIDNGIGILDAEEFLASNDRELVKQKDVKGSHSGWWEQDDVRISDVIKSDSKPKDVEISVIRKGSPKPLKFKLERRTFTVESVTSNVLEADNLGYIKLNCIAKTTGDELQKALSSLKQKNVKGLILDMRDLAGGSVESAIAVAKPFLGTNRIMTTVLHSHGKQTAIHMPSVPTEDRWDAPIIVLVNNGTASMAEVIAAALKENLSAKLVGEKTYGDFTETTVIDQKDGSAIVMTTGAFLTSKGGNYNGKGLPVDVVVASTASGDPQLKEAARLLAGGGIKD